ncbi:MAG: protein TolQ [Gammaproteobacteria bacterium]|nr:protein TolQ [Gammaproteobacteria bacterium]
MNESSILTLVMEASWVVKFVLLLLLLASVASWAIILQKSRVLRNAREISDDFETTFWSGSDLTTLHQRITGLTRSTQAMESIFKAGFGEFTRLRGEAGVTPVQIVEGSQRAMRVSQAKEIDRLEHNLATLATVGSTSPYVGLFGTVWGIMNAFQGLGSIKNPTLQLVAPGISEALVATAMGLFAAIPAVIAYNRYADQVDRLESRFDTFMEEFSSILQRYSKMPRGTQGTGQSQSKGQSNG